MKILKIVLVLLPEIPLSKRVGRPLVYQPAVMVCCLLVMIAKKLTVRGLHALLTRTDEAQSVAIRATIPFPDGKIPTRRNLNPCMDS